MLDMPRVIGKSIEEAKYEGASHEDDYEEKEWDARLAK
jgi:hypothetical protein